MSATEQESAGWTLARSLLPCTDRQGDCGGWSGDYHDSDCPKYYVPGVGRAFDRKDERIAKQATQMSAALEALKLARECIRNFTVDGDEKNATLAKIDAALAKVLP